QLLRPLMVVLSTVSANCWMRLKVAVTVWLAVMFVRGHVPVPEQAPLQPPKVEELGSGLALSVSASPKFTVCVQVPEVVPAVRVQLMLPPVTVPLPLPAPCTVTVKGLLAKLAAMVWLAVTLV